MEYVLGLLTLVFIYAMLTASLDLLISYSGLLSFGHAAFVGISAYASALLATKLGFGFVEALFVSCLVSGILAAVAALPMLRLSGDYFVLATFGFSMIATSVFENWVDLTNGPYGIYDIPHIKFLGWSAASPSEFAAVAAVALVIVLLAKHRLVSSPFGIVLKAIREDETVAMTLGKNITHYKVTVFAISAVLVAIPGTLLAYDLRFVEPGQFSFHFTIFLWAALFVGGGASLAGNIIGPAILIFFPEILRFLGLQGSYVAHAQQALYGLLLIVLILFRPQGIAGKFRLR